jgi:hypothetical protein
VFSEDHSATYGNLLCAAFSATCEWVAWSGKGLYENSPTAGTSQTIPQYYSQALGAGQEPFAPTWDARRFPPSAVVINLGTNDWGHSHDTGPAWEANFTATYVAFMRNLTLVHSNASLPIFAASGPLTSKPTPAILQAVAAHNAAGGSAIFLDLQTGPVIGCNGHPGPEDHAAMMRKAHPVIAEALGWGV